MRTDASKVFGEYLNYALQTESVQKEIVGESVGSTRASINSTILENLNVTLPTSIIEQKKIASILTSVDEVIENTQKQIEKLQDLKKGNHERVVDQGHRSHRVQGQ